MFRGRVRVCRSFQFRIAPCGSRHAVEPRVSELKKKKFTIFDIGSGFFCGLSELELGVETLQIERGIVRSF